METQAAKARLPDHALVSVRRVSSIKKLDSSQTHEVVMVDGWPVVVEKGRFAVDQKVLYFAIDCVLPSRDSPFEPYSSSLFLVELHGLQGWAVQTVKHEGHISQGMVLPVIHDWNYLEISRKRRKLGTVQQQSIETLARGLSLEKVFKIRKWSTFYPRDGGIILGRSPSFLPATKLERAQNMPELWKTHGDTEFQITEILDGTPMIFYDVSECSEDIRSQLPGVIINDEAENGVHERDTEGVSIGGQDYEGTEDSIGWNAVREQGIDTDVGSALAGVLCGSEEAGHHFFVYAMCDNDFKTWKPIDVRDNDRRGHLKSLEHHVPKFATRIRLSTFAKDLDELMKKAQGASCVSDRTRDEYPSLKRKGLAFRALDGSISFKVIANDWLLYETEELRKACKYKIVSRPGPNDCV